MDDPTVATVLADAATLAEELWRFAHRPRDAMTASRHCDRRAEPHLWVTGAGATPPAELEALVADWHRQDAAVAVAALEDWEAKVPARPDGTRPPHPWLSDPSGWPARRPDWLAAPVAFEVETPPGDCYHALNLTFQASAGPDGLLTTLTSDGTWVRADAADEDLLYGPTYDSVEGIMAAVEDVTALAEVARRADCLDQALAVLVAARDRLPPRSRYG